MEADKSGTSNTMADNEEPMTSAASKIEAALKSGPTPKKDEPPKILPKLDAPHGDTVENEKVSAEQEEPVNDLVMEKATAEALKDINPEMVFHRLQYLLAPRGFQHEPPRKDFSVDYNQNVKVFVVNCAVFSLDDILSKEMDLVFLRRLLDDILDVLDAERATMPPQMNSPPTCDPMLECLAAAPPCYSRADAELLASILDIS